ncbi:MAG TPA: SUMF1/EgtB/PvdO family nonheme iron enzyme, partial [Steroidobacteraceae bacterium]|nr:SUMF1/EgtB/PvdO family nonheme iron enzyme [Steroidobacteraceae bacterium]
AAPRSEGARSYPECSSMPVNPVRPQCRDPLGQTGFGPVIALVPAGSFAMGSDATSTEKPVHTVTIARPFGMAIYETSQAEYRAFCEATGRTFPSQSAQVDDLPVVNVSWADATAYAEWLSTASGKRYRLPTEAEWEYAARAGEKGVYAGGSQPAATDAYFSGAEKRTAPAPRSRPINKNRFWLLHMIGNVREWVQDAWSPSFDGAPADGSARNAPAGARVVRGGAYTDAASDLRLSQREKLDAGTHDARTGFRVARDSQ